MLIFARKCKFNGIKEALREDRVDVGEYARRSRRCRRQLGVVDYACHRFGFGICVATLQQETAGDRKRNSRRRISRR